MRRLTLATVTAVLLLAGCSSGNSSADDDTADTPTPERSARTSATASPQDPSAPRCEEIWKAGETLSKDYTACVEDGTAVSPDAVACTDGRSLIVHRDTFYAITGSEIVEPEIAPLQDTDEFGKAYGKCTGE